MSTVRSGCGVRETKCVACSSIVMVLHCTRLRGVGWCKVRELNRVRK